ncbi:hypothetical protein WA577_003730 [Blastocystis sp. JDR]
MPFLLLFIPCLLLHFLAHFTIPFHFFSIDSLPYSRHSPPSVRPTSTTTQSSPTSVLPYYSLSLLSSSMSNLHLSISPPIPKARNAKRTPVSTGNSHSLRQFIRNKTINNTVLVMVVDFGYLKVFLNSYFTSRLWEYPNLVVLCFDKRSFLILNKAQFPVYYESIGKDSSFAHSFADQATREFKKKIRWKITLLYRILHFGVNLLYMDCDVVLLKNPFPYVYSVSGVDLLVQRDGSKICTGFMYLVSSPTSKAMMRQANRYIRRQAMDDQDAVNLAVKKTRMPFLFLPSDAFPSGFRFFARHQLAWDLKNSPCVILHNNYVRGEFGKELRFKEMGLFSMDLNGEYSADRRYLTVECLDMRWGLVFLSHGRVAEAESEKPGAPRQPAGAHRSPATLPLPA